ncbi:serine/threonine-protein kinase DCLK1-like isoform X2 [Varroa destructor]|uniref:non-specific serine/threonine protein kinase n=1 Tax=Varroa destructor TaxID=109461 RepID=A0A7M7J9S5_VARDE|nr:serine/threonine-protein kinase DCLK1-like isoform X2 [Varroa destructor]
MRQASETRAESIHRTITGLRSGVNNGRHFQTVSVGCSASDDTKMTLSSVGGAEAAVGPPTPSLASPPSAFAPSPPKSALSNNGFWTLRHQRAGSQPGADTLVEDQLVGVCSMSSSTPSPNCGVASLLLGSTPAPGTPQHSSHQALNSLPPIGHSNSSYAISHSASRQSLQNVWMEKKAKKLKFYRNGDRFKGAVMYALSAEKTRCVDSLFADLTRLLTDSLSLPFGVRFVFRLSDGKTIKCLDDFEEGDSYVVSSTDTFIPMDYASLSTPRHFQLAGVGEARNNPSLDRSLRYSGSHQPAQNGLSVSNGCSRDRSVIRPRLVRVLRAGNKPRKFVRLLLNKRTAHTIEQVLDDLSRMIQLDSGAVRKVFSLSGAPVIALGDFFTSPDDVFLAFGKEIPSVDDFVLDTDEARKLACSQMRRETRFYGRPLKGDEKEGYKETKEHRRNGSADVRKSRDQSSPVYPASVTREFDIHNKIGDGNFATVYECRQKSTDKWFALKVIDQTKCRGKEMLVRSEVEVLQRMRHPNIVQLIKQIPSPETEELYLVMELVPGGDLFDAISQANQFSEEQAADLMTDLGQALAYLHNEQRVVHRDIKPENLLVVPETQFDRMRLKLADFGLAVEVRDDDPLFTVCGTPTYVAPEILAETGYGLKVDIWACGVILYILLCGFPPFASDNNSQEELFDKILAGQFEFLPPYFDHVSMAARDLIEKMLQVDANRRYSAQEMLEHPWMKTRCASPDSAMSMSTESMHFERKPTSSQSNTDSATSSL